MGMAAGLIESVARATIGSSRRLNDKKVRFKFAQQD